jgi:hypothetical protein
MPRQDAVCHIVVVHERSLACTAWSNYIRSVGKNEEQNETNSNVLETERDSSSGHIPFKILCV